MSQNYIIPGDIIVTRRDMSFFVGSDCKQTTTVKRDEILFVVSIGCTRKDIKLITTNGIDIRWDVYSNPEDFKIRFDVLSRVC